MLSKETEVLQKEINYIYKYSFKLSKLFDELGFKLGKIRIQGPLQLTAKVKITRFVNGLMNRIIRYTR